MASISVLIVQQNQDFAKRLRDNYKKLGARSYIATDLHGASKLFKKHQPTLLVLDLTILGPDWSKNLSALKKQVQDTRITLTVPKVTDDLSACLKDVGDFNLLTPNFSRSDLELTLQDLSTKEVFSTKAREKPERGEGVSKRWIPIRSKITIPYIILSLVLVFAAAYVITRIAIDSIEERFTNNLIEAGQLTAEWMVLEEDRLLETLRLLSRTRGVPDAIRSNNADELRGLVFPVAVNSMEESVEILDARGNNILSLRHIRGGNIEDYEFSHGDVLLGELEFVQKVIDSSEDAVGNKFAGIAYAPWGDYLYIAGPVFDQFGERVGVILIGKSLESMVRQMREATLAQVTIYGFEGTVMTSTFISEAPALKPVTGSEILGRQDYETFTRDMTISNIDYTEILGPWEARAYEDLGVIGVSLPQTFLVRASKVTRIQILTIASSALLIVIVVGVYIANHITRPLLRLVQASLEVARGNLRVKLPAIGNDEVATLTNSFNEMIAALDRSRDDLYEAYDTTLEGWARALELRDHDTESHTGRVVELTVKLARELGIGEEKITHIRRGALLHDIGKMGIPDHILHKPEPLDDEEWHLMSQHTVYAYNILSKIPFLRPALDIPHYHHERWDGSGYPHGLKGKEIPLAARIFAVADVWDALISDRPYRRAWPLQDVVQYIFASKRTLFDPNFVDAFLKMMDLAPPDTLVEPGQRRLYEVAQIR